MLNGLKDVKCIFVDEFFQLSPFNIYLLYLASVKFDIKITVSGDVLQVPSPDEHSVYDLRNNDFVNKVFFNNHIHLEYNPDSCRFTDDLPLLLKKLLQTRRIPSYFEEKCLTQNN